MKIFKLKNIAIFSSTALIMLIGLTSDAWAQSRREIERDRERYERQQREYERQNRRQGRNRNRRQDENVRVSPRQAMNANAQNGYDQGFIAGQYDARKRKYNNSNVYRNTGSAPNSGDPTSFDYAYRQGYLQGYEDGYRGRVQY